MGNQWNCQNSVSIAISCPYSNSKKSNEIRWELTSCQWKEIFEYILNIISIETKYWNICHA